MVATRDKYSIAGFGGRDRGVSVSRIPYRSKRSWKWAGIIVVHFTPRQVRVGPQNVVATIAGALSTGRARPRLPIQAKHAA
jgi:hypothetical protein